MILGKIYFFFNDMNNHILLKSGIFMTALFLSLILNYQLTEFCLNAYSLQ